MAPFLKVTCLSSYCKLWLLMAKTLITCCATPGTWGHKYSFCGYTLPGIHKEALEVILLQMHIMNVFARTAMKVKLEIKHLRKSKT